jgi:allophanate hydrolase subunit 2
MGYRLVGGHVRHSIAADVASLGVPLGAIQVPGDGRPIILLADHQPTGGYAVLACVIRADIGVVAQCKPSDELEFIVITHGEALAALHSREAEVRAVSPDATTWTALRWAEAGSLAVTGPFPRQPDLSLP